MVIVDQWSVGWGPVIAVLEAELQLLEAEIPANPRSPKGERLAKEVETEVRRYFRALQASVDVDSLADIYYRHVTEGGR